MLEIRDLNIQKNDFSLSSKQPLCFQEGHLHLIKGASGSGKTGLLYVLGLISDSQDFKYCYYGKRIVSQKQKDNLKKSEIGFVYQNFNMIETLNLYENLNLFANLKGRALSIKKAKEIMTLVRLNDISLKRRPSQLSGGQKQRFCLACVLAKAPKVIIADEPTSALDNQNADMMMLVLKSLAMKQNKIVIVSTHTKRYDKLSDMIFEIRMGEVNCLKSCVEKKEYQSKKLKEMKVKNSFYQTLLSHQLKQLFSKYRLLLVLTIIIFSFGIYMIDYFSTSVKDYENRINQAIQDEVILSTDILDIDEALILQDKIAKLQNINEVHPLYQTQGVITDKNGNQSNVVIYPIYPFQVTEDLPDSFYGDSSFLGNVGESYILQINGQQYSYQLHDIIDGQRLQAYGKGMKTLFIPAKQFDNTKAIFTGKFICDMVNFEAFDNMKENLLLMNKNFKVESTFRDMMLVKNNMALNRIYQYIAFIVMNIIIFILLCYMQYHEFQDKKKILCVYQANGLSKKDVIYLEGWEAFIKVGSYFVGSCLLISLMMVVGNHFFLAKVKQHFDLTLFGLLGLMLVIEFIVPHIVTQMMIWRMNIEDELRANV